MLELVIIEDEVIELKFLYKLINNHFKEQFNITTFDNGFDGCNFILKNNPDIVLLDIEMPGLTGLELLEEVRKHKEITSKFIFLTSYNYFDYAQKAIKLQVEDFLLKPVKNEELLATIQKIVDNNATNELKAKVEKVRALIDSDLIRSVIASDDKTKLNNIYSLIEYNIYSALVVIIKNYADYPINKIINHLKINYEISQEKIQSMLVIFVFKDRLITNTDVYDIRYFLKQYVEESDLGISEVTCDKYALQGLYKSVLANFENSEISLFSNDYMEQIVDRMIQNIYVSNKNALFEIINSINLTSLNSIELKQWSIQFRGILAQKIQEKIGFINNMLLEEINAEETLLGIQKYILSALEYNNNNSNILVLHACKYIQDNYMKPISLNDVAKHLDVSVFYLSKLLNNDANINFSEMVNNLRIEEACKQLKTNKRVKEIAFDLGFQSQNYFAKVFKKYTGLTPKEYRVANFK